MLWPVDLCCNRSFWCGTLGYYCCVCVGTLQFTPINLRNTVTLGQAPCLRPLIQQWQKPHNFFCFVWHTDESTIELIKCKRWQNKHVLGKYLTYAEQLFPNKSSPFEDKLKNMLNDVSKLKLTSAFLYMYSGWY